MKDESPSDSFILHPSSFILCRFLLRALRADVIIREVFLRRRLAQAADAVMFAASLVELARRRLVVHGPGVVARNTRLFSRAEGSMIHVRKAAERGHFDHGWLDTYHTFSFADYYDPDFMGFRDLRVINEDRVAPGTGFGRHGHRDMEIVTVVLEGALAHRDSTGGSGVLRPGEVQHMSAGTGVLHSEMNASEREPVHLYQIWLLPERNGITP